MMMMMMMMNNRNRIGGDKPLNPYALPFFTNRRSYSVVPTFQIIWQQQPTVDHHRPSPPPSQPTLTPPAYFKKAVEKSSKVFTRRKKLFPRKKGSGDNKSMKYIPVRKIQENSGCQSPEKLLEGKTSLMIKNIPNQFGRNGLIRIVDDHCHEENSNLKGDASEKSEYDFLYLPMDFRHRANKGYAFVNFTTPVAAVRFFKAFHKYQWKVSVNKKICEIVSANIQGKGAFQSHFKNSTFDCHTDSYLPAVFSPPRDGWHVLSCPTPIGMRCRIEQYVHR